MSHSKVIWKKVTERGLREESETQNINSGLYLDAVQEEYMM